MHRRDKAILILGQTMRKLLRFAPVAMLLMGCVLLPAQQEQANALPDSPLPQNQSEAASMPSPIGQPQLAVVSGSISGVVTDATGAAISGAAVELIWDDPSHNRQTRTDNSGQFTFPGVGGGRFRLAIAALGFAPATYAGELSAGQVLTTPPIMLEVATADTEVQVHLTRTEIAQEQLDIEDKQRVIGVFPNFYVSYAPHPAPLTPRQKFVLAGRLMIDPVSFGITGLTAGVQQATNSYSGYGQGASGYGKRFAASSGTFFTGVLIGNAILPSILKQDPRYFYKGTGTVRSRILYAIANAVVCKGDNGKWQANYSSIVGGFAAAGLSNLYYPAKNRDGAELTFVDAAIGTAGSAAGNLVEEFFLRKITSHSGKARANP